MPRDEPALGDEATLEVEVDEAMLVDLGGRRIHPLYSTASMVRHMEEASRMLIEPHLRDGEDATGYSVSVTHERPARIGERLTVVARVTRIDERACDTEVRVDGPHGRVGSGTVTQRYIPADLFQKGS